MRLSLARISELLQPAWQAEMYILPSVPQMGAKFSLSQVQLSTALQAGSIMAGLWKENQVGLARESCTSSTPTYLLALPGL